VIYESTAAAKTVKRISDWNVLNINLS